MKQAILGFSLAIVFSTSAVLAAPTIKPAQLQGTQYCQDQEKIKGLSQIVHLDERNRVDRIVIHKKTKKMYLLSGDRIYKTYNVAFGFGSLEGNKVRQGDGRTPEGLYFVEAKNAQSKYTKALRVSYPNAFDKEFARKIGVSTGADIMIHGFPSSAAKERQLRALEVTHPRLDWTEGCIAVTSAEIEEIFPLIREQTAIEICPERTINN